MNKNSQKTLGGLLIAASAAMTLPGCTPDNFNGNPANAAQLKHTLQTKVIDATNPLAQIGHEFHVLNNGQTGEIASVTATSIRPCKDSVPSPVCVQFRFNENGTKSGAVGSMTFALNGPK